mmetsp:Transcript_52152/g.124772  ORF Transcript_52152/g.124772 Transcript_52152/m.124772 type:complete len:258 (-) Transcript_52152:82-855(-)
MQMIPIICTEELQEGPLGQAGPSGGLTEEHCRQLPRVTNDIQVIVDFHDCVAEATKQRGDCLQFDGPCLQIETRPGVSVCQLADGEDTKQQETQLRDLRREQCAFGLKADDAHDQHRADCIPQQCQPASLYCEAKQHTENKGPVGQSHDISGPDIQERQSKERLQDHIPHVKTSRRHQLWASCEEQCHEMNDHQRDVQRRHRRGLSSKKVHLGKDEACQRHGHDDLQGVDEHLALHCVESLCGFPARLGGTETQMQC